MTIAQIKKAKYFLEKIEKVNSYLEMEVFKNEVQNFYGEECNIQLRIRVHNTIESYTSVFMEQDKAAIKNFIEGVLAKSDENIQVFNILDLIEEGKLTIEKKKGMPQFISKVYYAYSNKIEFDQTTMAAATAPQDALSIGLIKVDDSMVNGVLVKLEDYAIELLKPKQEIKRTSSLQINNYNTASATNEVTVEISIMFENAIKQIEDACLPDEQEKEVIKKINELKEIIESKESKRNRWEKIKGFFKWIAEQGIQVASIIVPLLTTAIK